MKVITLQQPWAAFVAKGIKNYETRSWQTKYRGLIAIHAARNSEMRLGECVALYEKIRELGTDPGSSIKFAVGGIVAIAEITRVYKTEDWIGVSEVEKLVGDWRTGRYAWELKNVIALRKPIPMVGRQKLTELEPQIEAMCKEAICFTP